MSTASSITHISAIAEMVESYLEHFVEEKNNLQTLSEQLDGGDVTLTCRSNMIGHLTASALVLRRYPGDDSRLVEVGGAENHLEVLLIHHLGLNRWLQPGGHLDSNEDPEAGARRELMEETGLVDIELLDGFAGPGSVFDIDSHLIPANAKKSESSHLHHDFQYIYMLKGTDQIALQQDEVSKFAWTDLTALDSGKYGSRLRRVARKLAGMAQNKNFVTVGKI
jgi:8-oxo-dGTP pyrophosphatase MutT (NUDIX family)